MAPQRGIGTRALPPPRARPRPPRAAAGRGAGAGSLGPGDAAPQPHPSAPPRASCPRHPRGPPSPPGSVRSGQGPALTSQPLARPCGCLRSGSDTHYRGRHSGSNSSASFSGPPAPPSGPRLRGVAQTQADPAPGFCAERSLTTGVLRPEVGGRSLAARAPGCRDAGSCALGGWGSFSCRFPWLCLQTGKTPATCSSPPLRLQSPEMSAIPAEESDQLLIRPLGAGQEVGRSCIILEFKGRKIMLDCGIHPGLEGMDALPYIDLIDPAEIDLLLISQ